MLAERADTLIGEMLGKDYRVLERIGSGGMAVVYLVEHQILLKQFAAKVLSSELASSLEARARFTQEAHAASQLDHENIVSISDFGVTVDHRPFFVMELLRGQTLDQRLLDGPMSIEEVVAVSVPVARALAHAHAEGIVHRDVKPENIFLVQRSQGRWGVKVVDFGIAKTPVHPKLTHTKPKLGETLGSPRFMAPEMCRGDDDAVDQRADIYSFGVMLYLMLCGRLPFDDDNLLRLLQMHLSEPLPPPREINPDLAPELAAILERALAKHPDDRYPSIDALLLDLEAALPPGADRLLIEAQSGTSLSETPFAGALAVARTSSQRVAQQSPAGATPLAPHSAPQPRATPAPAGTAAAPVSASSQLAVPPAPSASSSLPVARRRSRALIAIAAIAVVASLCAVLLWRFVVAPPQGTRSAARAATATTIEVTPIPVEVTPTPALPPPRGDDVIEHSASVEASTEVPATPAVSPKPGRPAPILKRMAPPHPAIVRDRRRPGTDSPGTAPPTQVAAADPEAQASEPRATETGASPVPAGDTSTPEQAAQSAHTAQGAPGPQSASAAPPAAAPPAAAPPGALPPVAPPPASAPRPAPVAPKGPGSLDAVPEVASLDVKGSLSTSVVRRSVERTLSALRACYASAARASRATPAIDLQLNFEIDENGLATHVTAGNTSLGSLARCATGVASQIHTPVAPDIGTVQVVLVIHFRPS